MSGLDNYTAPAVPREWTLVPHASTYTFLAWDLELWSWCLEGPSLAPSLFIVSLDSFVLSFRLSSLIFFFLLPSPLPMEWIFSPLLISFYTLYLHCFWGSSWVLTSKHLFIWCFSFMESMYTFPHRTFRKMLMYEKVHLCVKPSVRLWIRDVKTCSVPSGPHGLVSWEIHGLMQWRECLRRRYAAVRESLETQMGIHGDSRPLPY